MVLVEGPRGRLFLMSEVPLYPLQIPAPGLITRGLVEPGYEAQLPESEALCESFRS